MLEVEFVPPCDVDDDDVRLWKDEIAVEQGKFSLEISRSLFLLLLHYNM